MLSLLGLAVGCSLIMDDLPPPPDEDTAPIAGGAGEAPGGAGGAIGAAGMPAAAGDAGEAGTSSSGCADECDCDGDDGVAEGDCGGDDCDDDDPEVFTGQTQFFDRESRRNRWDFDCSGTYELEKPMLDCMAVMIPCDAPDEGFIESAPQCGTEADWGRCVLDTLMCVPEAFGPKQLVKCH